MVSRFHLHVRGERRLSDHHNDRIHHICQRILRNPHNEHSERNLHSQHNRHILRIPHSQHSLRNLHNGNIRRNIQTQSNAYHSDLCSDLHLYNSLLDLKELIPEHGTLQHLSAEDRFEIDSFLSPPLNVHGLISIFLSAYLVKHFLQHTMSLGWVMFLMKARKVGGQNDESSSFPLKKGVGLCRLLLAPKIEGV